MKLKSVDTLRVSVTDRCNLRCVYCMPAEGVPHIPHSEVLRFEEIERVARTAVSLGVTKIRITGGEPLVRKGVTELVKRLSLVRGIDDLPMTTNGVLLEHMAGDLKRAGLSRVTVSMDTLQPDRYAKITRRPWLDRVIKGIEKARELRLDPVKINVVIVPGVNDDEVMDFVGLAGELDVEVRFIERMPIRTEDLSPHCGLVSDEYVPSGKLLKIIEASEGKLEPLPSESRGQPAKVYKLPGSGRIGFISPMSEPFCRHCSRMRLTPDGKLRPCLVMPIEVDVKGPMRGGASDKNLVELFNKAVSRKPKQDAVCFGPTNRIMSQIGG